MLNRKAFYDSMRFQFGNFNQKQVDGFNMVLNYWEQTKMSTDLRHLAYIIATAWHESAHTMQAIEEYGHGRGRKYGIPDPVTGLIYFGRGLVQLTWADNYKLMGKLLGIPLYENPDLALDPAISVQVIFEGMFKGKSNRGDFTGVSLENYFNASVDDPYNARRIVNGLDCAQLIAGHYYKILDALRQAA